MSAKAHLPRMEPSHVTSERGACVDANCLAVVFAQRHQLKVPFRAVLSLDHLHRQEIVNPIANIVGNGPNIIMPVEAQMNAPPHSEATSERSIPDSALETENASAAKQEFGERAAKIGCDSERITSSVALFTSKSIKELEGLTFELQGLQEFLKSETEHVQRDIDNALAGLKIIIDTISPWRNARPDASAQERTSRSDPRIQRSNLAGAQK